MIRKMDCAVDDARERNIALGVVLSYFCSSTHREFLSEDFFFGWNGGENGVEFYSWHRPRSR